MGWQKEHRTHGGGHGREIGVWMKSPPKAHSSYRTHWGWRRTMLQMPVLRCVWWAPSRQTWIIWVAFGNNLLRAMHSGLFVFFFSSQVVRPWSRSKSIASFYRWGARAMLAPRSHSFFLFNSKRPFSCFWGGVGEGVPWPPENKLSFPHSQLNLTNAVWKGSSEILVHLRVKSPGEMYLELRKISLLS